MPYAAWDSVNTMKYLNDDLHPRTHVFLLRTREPEGEIEQTYPRTSACWGSHTTIDGSWAFEHVKQEYINKMSYSLLIE